jgi:hypothetical protein
VAVPFSSIEVVRNGNDVRFVIDATKEELKENTHINRNVYRANINRNVNVSRNVNVNRNANFNRSVNVNRRYVCRNGQRGYWRNGVWVAAPAAAVC